MSVSMAFSFAEGWTWCVSRTALIMFGAVVRAAGAWPAEVSAPARTNSGEIDDLLRRGFVCVRRLRRRTDHFARMALFVYAIVSHDLFAIIIKLLVIDEC